MTINTSKNENDTPISDAYSFPRLPAANEDGINSQSETYSKNKSKISVKKNFTNYLINLDWLQFVALKIVEVDFTKFISENFVIIEQVNKNPNFKNCFLVKKNGVDILELHVNPANKSYSNNEVLIKIKNNLLYVNDYTTIVNEILKELGLIFWRISRIDIALDGTDILRIMDILRRFTKNKTIQIGNNNLKVDPGNLIKSDLTFESYRIGNKKCQKSAITYVKSDEIKKSNKNYISEWWLLNGIDTEQKIGRFEIQLNYQHLKKYNINSLEMLMDTAFIGSIFINEIKDWLKIYRVKLKDIENHRTNYAIRKGKEIKLFHWDSIPSKMIGISLDNARIDPITNAKRSITFAVNDLIDSYTNNVNTTGNTVNFISSISAKYDLDGFVARQLENKLSMTETLNKNDITFITQSFCDSKRKSDINGIISS